MKYRTHLFGKRLVVANIGNIKFVVNSKISTGGTIQSLSSFWKHLILMKAIRSKVITALFD